ncbi:hypothetical protein LGM75_23985 [Burkholderia multivorans]|uniref:hypothetical protein n=1 Tax=Burkholderia multivorans TaxID=87883 RepID=UPI001C22F577|nr:hypothetical protein [Burkholderia multivorans]MBU9468338.1 hypothetical protein [Burkholderia multivorans]MCA8129416.1 hypothetical protein [Burkholderia multivorans]
MNSKLTADQDTLLEKFHVLIDDYAHASRNGSTDERVSARLALANAYVALLAPTQQPSGEVTDDDKEDAARWRHFYGGHYIICKVHTDGTVKNLGGGYVAKYAIDAARAQGGES